MAGLREAKKMETRSRLREAGLRLFFEKGYEATTVEQIASSAGVSHMTFFRYFSGKDSLVLSDDYDILVSRALEDRAPTGSTAVDMGNAILDALRGVYPARERELLQRWTLVLRTPELAARQAQRVASTQDLLVRGVSHGELSRDTQFYLEVTAAVYLAAATTASLLWARGGGVESLLTLVERSFTILRQGDRDNA